jgi:hypothetical protein
MIHIDLDTIERNILLETLVSYLSDLSVEIADTDSSEFRSQLKTKRDVLNKILDAVNQAH